MGMPENRDVLSPAETQKVLHELRVHQVELEMQNEELRNAQEELEASPARYFDLYDLAPVGYLSVSEQGLILEANLTFATMLGVARARGALLQQPLTHFILPEDEDIYYLHRKSLLETGVPQVCELRVLREDGARFWARLEATAAQEAEGAAVSRIAVSDITERKQSEELLRASEQRYRILFGSANDGIMLHDLKGQILEANGVVSEQLGYGSEELLGMNVTNIRVPEAAALYPKHMDEVRERGRVACFVRQVRQFKGFLAIGRHE